MKDIEIMIYGRGGQGVKTCAQIIAESALFNNFNIQAFPEYGPERRGAPVRSFVRISNKEITKHYPINDPDIVLVLDETLFNFIDNIKEYSNIYIINTKKDVDNYKKLITKSKQIYTIDASKIAYKNLKINNVNIVMIGALLKIIKIIDIKNIKKVIKKTFTKKNKEELIEPNIKCLKEGYDYF
jgi:pyruvate ferredoxin oxidoreductase gamma subunit